MDQELFENGQYQSILEKLLEKKEAGHSLSSMAEQMSTSLNIAVCKYLLEQQEEARKMCHESFVDVLNKCSSVPVREDILLVELSALYNYIYHHIASGWHTEEYIQEAGIYNQVYKTFSRVLQLVAVYKGKLDVLKYGDTKTACSAMFDDILEQLQYSIGKEFLSIQVCHCLIILGVRRIKSEDNGTTYKLLEKVKKALKEVDINTGNDSQRTLCLPLRIEHSQLTLGHSSHIVDVSSFLMGVCLCRGQSWEEASNILEGIKSYQIKNAAQFLCGFSLFKSGSYTESISCLMEVLRSGDSLTQRLKARIYNLIGKCFDQHEKCQLSIQMFKEALCADFSYLVPLFNTALQYRKQVVDDMELECLNLLVTALEMREVSVVQYEGIDLITLLNTEDEDIPYVEALYSLCHRSLQLKRYDVAAEKYASLLEHLKSWKADKKGMSCIPALLQVHHEAIEALLKSKKYGECVTLCDRVLLCYHNNSTSLNESSFLSQTLDHSLLSQSQGYLSGSQSGRGKRKFDDLSQSQSDNEHFGDVDVIALKYKAEALVKMGDKSGSLVCLQRAIDSITSYRKFRLQEKMKNITPKSGEPIRKRQKTNQNSYAAEKSSSQSHDLRIETTKNSSRDVTQSSQTVSDKADVIGQLFSNSTKILKIEQELYEMTAEILQTLDNKRDALHYNRLASQIQNIQEKL